MRHDLAIIGGGIVGAAAAHRAAHAGARVLVLDRADPGRATDAGAGIVAPAFNTRDGAPLRELAVAAARAYPALISELSAQGFETGYERVGLLAVAVDEHEQPAFSSFRKLVTDRRDAAGHPTGHELRDLESDDARARYPILGAVKAALLDTGAARVDGRLLATALLTSARQAGAEVRTSSVDSVADVARDADAVLIAGGAWSPRFADELLVSLSVVPQRGQIAHLLAPEEFGDSSSWPMLSLLSDQYQVSWPGRRVAVGATREDGSGFANRTTAAGVRRVLDEALRVAPGLGEAELLEVRVGLRPVTPDLRPLIGRIAGHERVIVATGHGPTGLANGPFSGRLAADLALGHDIGHDIEPFAVDRSFE